MCIRLITVGLIAMLLSACRPRSRPDVVVSGPGVPVRTATLELRPMLRADTDSIWAAVVLADLGDTAIRIRHGSCEVGLHLHDERGRLIYDATRQVVRGPTGAIVERVCLEEIACTAIPAHGAEAPAAFMIARSVREVLGDSIRNVRVSVQLPVNFPSAVAGGADTLYVRAGTVDIGRE